MRPRARSHGSAASRHAAEPHARSRSPHAVRTAAPESLVARARHATPAGVPALAVREVARPPAPFRGADPRAARPASGGQDDAPRAADRNAVARRAGGARADLPFPFDEREWLRRLGPDPVPKLVAWFEAAIFRGDLNAAASSCAPAFLFFDEVQNLENRAAQSKALVDHTAVRVMLTGSSAPRIARGRRRDPILLRECSGSPAATRTRRHDCRSWQRTSRPCRPATAVRNGSATCVESARTAGRGPRSAVPAGLSSSPCRRASWRRSTASWRAGARRPPRSGAPRRAPASP